MEDAVNYAHTMYLNGRLQYFIVFFSDSIRILDKRAIKK